MMHRQILRLAIPAIISNITTPLLGLVDTAITGHLGAAVYLAAIAVGSTMFSMVYWLMAFLRMGTSGMTAQACGADDLSTARQILRRGLNIAAVVSVALIALSPWMSDLLLAVMDADAETTGLARRYYMIVIWGAPAVLAVYALSGWMLGMQDSRGPMWMAIVTNVVNIAVSLVLVYGFELKIEGVATGTVTAQWAGLAVGMWLYRRMDHTAEPRGTYTLKSDPNPAERADQKPVGRHCAEGDSPRGAVDDQKPVGRHCAEGDSPRGAVDVSWGRFFRVNADIFLRTVCLVAVTVWFTRAGARLGTDILAANALLMQLFILFSYFMDGFAFAGEALAGKYYGAADRPGLVQVVRGVYLWGIAVVVLFTLIYMLGGDAIMRVLTDDYGVVQTAGSYLLWAVAVPVAGVMAFVWDGIFIGMTLTRQMLWSMFAALVVFFGVYLLATPTMGNHGLWLAFILYLLTRGLVQTAVFAKRVTAWRP